MNVSNSYIKSYQLKFQKILKITYFKILNPLEFPFNYTNTQVQYVKSEMLKTKKNFSKFINESECELMREVPIYIKEINRYIINKTKEVLLIFLVHFNFFKNLPLDTDEWCEYLLRNPSHLQIPSFITLTQTTLTFIPSSAQIEQHFSVLNRIKTIKCSQMLLDLMNSLSRIRINGEQRILSVEEVNTIFDIFISTKQRRNRSGSVADVVSPVRKNHNGGLKRARIDYEEIGEEMNIENEMGIEKEMDIEEDECYL